MNTEVDPYEQLRLDMNKRLDMRDDYLKCPSVFFTIQAVSPEAAQAAADDMYRAGTLGFVSGLEVTVAVDDRVGGSFEDGLACAMPIIGIAAGK